MNGLEIKNVTKQYGRLTALQDVNLTLEDNKIYGLLGRNGAGKSTLLNIITGRVFATSGTACIQGQPTVENDKLLTQIYLMSEKTYYPATMKIYDVFRWTKEFYPAFDEAYARTLLNFFGLHPSKRVRELSTGYNSILKNIIGLSTNVPYVLFDEPVLGLDANHRDLFYKLVLESYMKCPRTIVISTHLIDEVANVVEKVVIIKQGRVIVDSDRDELLSKGYAVSGTIGNVDAYIQDRNVLGADVLGGLKTAYILGTPSRASLGNDLTLSRLDLQKLFIKMTND